MIVREFYSAHEYRRLARKGRRNEDDEIRFMGPSWGLGVGRGICHDEATSARPDHEVKERLFDGV